MYTDIHVGESPAMKQNNSVGFSPDPVLQFELPPYVKRVMEIIGSLLVGGLAGYIGYWITRLVVKLTGVGGSSGAINPVGYVLSGMVSAAIVETARLAYDIMMHILGDRQKFENLANPNATALDLLRQRTWKVVSHVEGIGQDIDLIFSRIFNVHTAKEIRDTDIQDYQLCFIEIARRAFWEEVSDTIRTSIPQEISLHLVEAAGYTILGGHLFVWLRGLMFFNGVTSKIQQVYMRNDAKEIADARKRWQELEKRPSCEIAAAMNLDSVVI